jgi:WD40 repeat protein
MIQSQLMGLTSQSREPQILPDLPKSDSNGAVSPNGKWLAYSGDMILYILSSDGKIEASLPRNAQWRRFQGWLDNERIVFDRGERIPVAVNVVNPFTGEDQYMMPRFKDFYTYTFEDSGWFTWKLVYDPTLTRVAYMRDNGESQGKSPSLVLVDLENNQTLWELERYSPGEWLMPTWSPDGSQMAAYAADDPQDDYKRFQLFTVDRMGQATQWIDVRKAGIVGGIGTEMKWSPDGRYLAFFGGERGIYILDMLEHRVLDYCLPYSTYSGAVESQATDVILWSPDSKQVLYQRYDAPAVVIDLESNRAAQLVENASIRPIGWLKSEP